MDRCAPRAEREAQPRVRSRLGCPGPAEPFRTAGGSAAANVQTPVRAAKIWS